MCTEDKEQSRRRGGTGTVVSVPTDMQNNHLGRSRALINDSILMSQYV